MSLTNCLSDYQLLTISLLPRVGRKTISEIVSNTSSRIDANNDLYDALLGLEGKIKRFKSPDKSLFIKVVEESKFIIEKLSKEGINLIGIGNEFYPNLLKCIPDPPVLLFYKGDIKPIIYKKTVAVIGTREPSDYGKRWAERLGAYIARRDIGVISGLALGCDSHGHIGALNESGYTAAILAHGLDKIFPAKNRELGNKILNSGGCLISEYLPGTRPMKNYFIERNRIQSGLSCGIVIVESDNKGGSMHTANFAQKQGRPIGCLQHPKKYSDFKSARGNVSLIEENKAIPISTENDLINFLNSIIDVKRENINDRDLSKHRKHQQVQLFENL